MPFISYAQNNEDVLLHRVFGGQEIGFYVDIGAYDPVNGSVTKAFYDRGWSGLNVEPGSIFVALAAARPRDVNLQIAVYNRVGEVRFDENLLDRGMSRVSDSDKGELIPCDTLESIVLMHCGRRPIDFLKIDVEGSESAIICSTDWRQLRPTVLIIEATQPWSTVIENDDWEPHLRDHGYRRVYFDGINCFYVPEEQIMSLSRHFQAPVNVLDQVRRFDPQLDEIVDERTRLASALAAANEQNSALSCKVTELEELHATVILEAQRAASEYRETIAAANEQHAAIVERRLGDLEKVHEATLNSQYRLNERDLNDLAAERDAALSARHAVSAELASTITQRDRLEKQLELLAARFEVLVRSIGSVYPNTPVTNRPSEVSQPVISPQLPHTSAPTLVAQRVMFPSRPLARRVGKKLYWLLRPTLRPVAFRLRTFITSKLMDTFEEQMSAIVRALEGLQRQMGERTTPLISVDDLHLALRPLRDLEQRVASSGTELRELASEMQRVLLTFALESARVDYDDYEPVAIASHETSAVTYETTE